MSGERPKSTELRRDLGLGDGDAVYESLVAMLDGISEEDSSLVLAKLVLLLANHIGDDAVIAEAIATARNGV